MFSRIPEVIEALVQYAEADPELKGVAVMDGPQVIASTALDWLIPGFDGDPTGDFEAAQSVAEFSDLGTHREETFQVTVAAISNRGDVDVVAARRRAYEIGARVVVWLQAEPSLGLPGLEAFVQATRLVQDQTEQGASARLLLTVAGRGFI